VTVLLERREEDERRDGRLQHCLDDDVRFEFPDEGPQSRIRQLVAGREPAVTCAPLASGLPVLVAVHHAGALNSEDVGLELRSRAKNRSTNPRR